MNIGVINESSKIENRAGLSPSGVSFLVEKGHTVFLQAGAGQKAGYSNEDYNDLGAEIVFTKEEVFGRSDVVLNISPLNDEECSLARNDQICLSTSRRGRWRCGENGRGGCIGKSKTGFFHGDARVE